MKVETLGDLIRARRGEQALSLRALARQVKVTASFLSDIEWGKRFPSAAVLARIAVALDMPVESFAPFDHRQLVQSLQKLLAKEPTLTKTLSDVVKDVSMGSLTVNDLLARLTGAAGAKNSSVPTG